MVLSEKKVTPKIDHTKIKDTFYEGSINNHMPRRKITTDVPSVLDPSVNENEHSEKILRPQRLDDYVGQPRIKEQISIAVKSAQKRNTSIDHVLLFGPPGLGKTTMAYIIANEMGAKMHYIAGPQIMRPGDIASSLARLQENDILFVDEIHRMNPAAEEVLYSAMEDRFINISVGMEAQSKQYRIDLPAFTLVGATTRAGMISSPLHDRFGIICKMEYYTIQELSDIVYASAKVMKMDITSEQAENIARRSRGTPRIANRCVARVRDYAIAKNEGVVTDDVVDHALSVAGITEYGLDCADMLLLQTLSIEKPIGLQTLACILGDDAETIENVQEPYLIMSGYMEKTPKGRVLTEKGNQILRVSGAN